MCVCVKERARERGSERQGGREKERERKREMDGGREGEMEAGRDGGRGGEGWIEIGRERERERRFSTPTLLTPPRCLCVSERECVCVCA